MPRIKIHAPGRQSRWKLSAFRSVRHGKAYYSADPSEGVSRNPCQQNIGNLTGALNRAFGAVQDPGCTHETCYRALVDWVQLEEGFAQLTALDSGSVKVTN